ncbi:MAG: lactate racemase domain-containing protein [Candidatus Sumerlaeota bacterium]|nr:lactate racemase domain-containing protein [Candidatus Sumerlaeota bacterium]
MEYFFEGSKDIVVTEKHAGELVDGMLARMGAMKRVLLLPPDLTRMHSWAGELTVMLYERLKGKAHIEIMPALGTHAAMTEAEIKKMFPGVPLELFRAHDWRNALVRLGEVPGEFVKKVTDGLLDYPIYCEVNRLLIEGKWDRIISVGQLVPHEVIGIANHNKNIFVGVGGQDTINKTHFIGAVYGMERMMGRASTPVRAVFNYMSEHFAKNLPISYLLTVRARDAQGRMVTRGLYAGDDSACFERGAKVCQQVNLDLLDKPLQKTVVYLDPHEFKSTWLGNKAIYRTRMAMATGGELVILGPAVKEFGEDKEIDRLIRKYGYRGTPHTLKMVKENPDLGANLSAAAHLIHGSSEGRFEITYCPGKLTREEIEGAGFRFGELDKMIKHYDPAKLRDGANRLPGGEEVFFISNPALGLWGLKSQFE